MNEFQEEIHKSYVSFVHSEIQDRELKSSLLRFGEPHIKSINFDNLSSRKVLHRKKRKYIDALELFVQEFEDNFTWERYPALLQKFARRSLLAQALKAFYDFEGFRFENRWQVEIRRSYITSVDSKIQDSELKSTLLEFGESYIQTFSLEGVEAHGKKDRYKKALEWFITGIDDNAASISDLSWEIYCVLYHKFEDRYVNPKKILQNFYLFIGEKYNQHEVATYSHLFIGEDIHRKGNADLGFNSNYPLGSKPQHIYSFYVDVGRFREGYFSNINLNTDNTLVHNWLAIFLKLYSRKYDCESSLTLYMRAFVYYFNESISDQPPESTSLTYFSKDLFVKQLEFYKQIAKRHRDKSEQFTKIFQRLLKSFYLIIDEKYLKENSIPLFNTVDFNSTVISGRHFIQHLESDYLFVYLAPQDPIPLSDKWLLVDDLNVKNASAIHGKSLHSLDFSKVEDEELRIQLKSYIWASKESNGYAATQVITLTHFINTAVNNYQNNVVPLRGEKALFSTQFILNYRAYVELRPTIYGDGHLRSVSTINGCLLSIKKFLKHLSKRCYKINQLTLKQLKGLTYDKYMEGNSFTKEDFEIIKTLLREKATDLDGKLNFIIFQLSIQTKLRVGEILSLERNCITSKTEQLMTGTISYISKVSNGEYIESSFLIEDINLIEESIRLTEDLTANASEDLKKFIFIHRASFHRRVELIGSNYARWFNILCKENNLDYTAYNARHTFVDHTWQAVEDGKMSAIEANYTTGHKSEKIPTKNYRKFQTKRYLEAFYEVHIGNVDIEGNILKPEEIEGLQQVEDGAGACTGNECIKLITLDADDDDHVCLRCKQFATAISRIPVFEEKVERYSRKKQESEIRIEQEYYQNLIDLYSAYLMELSGNLEAN
ncbi:hypothetical protein [Desulfosporosinus lacus]|uniref:Phage integrase family protein n=1 Tax=Desulfosporosinus lacus DSM 15449 TaxID=1121420 RepID=A0A1M5QRH3_9FIRM|nr:hypothetical protein [Desulfosporosinus lacus]SHH16516.1 hypothetical protein SAMN02746098_00339 [Desulfosporosinus lacus DSM 15449]